MPDCRNMRNYEMGVLINKAEKGKYTNKNAIRNLIKYINREEGSSKNGSNDVLCSGAYGSVDFMGSEFATTQFEDVQHCYIRAGKTVRYADHEMFTFSPIVSQILKEKPELLPKLANRMAAILSDGQYQVYYGVHMGEEDHFHTAEAISKKGDSENNLHVHFAVNTVNFRTLRKRQETRAATAEHEKRMQELIEKEVLGQSLSSPSVKDCKH